MLATFNQLLLGTLKETNEKDKQVGVCSRRYFRASGKGPSLWLFKKQTKRQISLPQEACKPDILHNKLILGKEGGMDEHTAEGGYAKK